MRRIAVVLATMLAACHNPTASEGATLRASARDGVLIIENRSASPVRYLVEAERFVPLADLVCTRAKPCGELLQGNGAVVIPYRDIRGYMPNERAAVIAYSFDVDTAYPYGRLRVTVALP